MQKITFSSFKVLNASILR